MTSPTSKPARAAAEFGSTKPIRADVLGTAERHEQAGEQHQRENEIGDRSGGDDRRAVAAAAGRASVRDAVLAAVTLATASSGVLAASASPEKFDVSAERKQRRDAIACRDSSTRASSSGPNPSEKASILTPHQRPTEIMAELVKEHDRAHDDDERQDVPAHPIEEAAELLETTPSSSLRGAAFGARVAKRLWLLIRYHAARGAFRPRGRSPDLARYGESPAPRR